MRGTIPDFSSGDVELAYTINGEKVNDNFPTKESGYKINNITCDGATGSWDEDKWGAIITEISSTKVKCNIDFKKVFNKHVAIGDYVEMTPISTSYEISNDLTGCTGESNVCNGLSSQIINPSKLNIWRVIKKNDDGTVEMISEYASDEKVYFYGRTGYLNFVGTLNTIAKQYENENFTNGSRYIGYNGQTEYITDTSKVQMSGTAPFASNEANLSENEPKGGGDILYKDDINLLKNVFDSLCTDNNADLQQYWVASRNYYTTGKIDFSYKGRAVYKYGCSDLSSSYSQELLGSSRSTCGTSTCGSLVSSSRGARIRPIVILKSGLEATGSGTSESPWILQ